MAAPCYEGSDENVGAAYGYFNTTLRVINEGNPICQETEGDGKIVGRVTVAGQTAKVSVYCDFTDQEQWRNCRPADIAKYGGDIRVTLPGAGGLRGTDVRVTTRGKNPLTYGQLVRIIRSLTQVGR